MKKNVRNALAISGLAIAIGTSGFILDASANTGKTIRVQRSHQERIVRTRKVEKTVRTTVSRTIPGVVSAVSDSSITMTSGNKTYTVNVSSARVLNRQWKSINLSDIKSGDKIRVFGSLTGTTVTAKTVRDISIQ